MAKLIVGLGNPGENYEKNRHNVGFMAVSELRKALEFEKFKEEKKFNAEITQGILGTEKIILAKPLTFMNNSGTAVQKIANFYKIEPKDIVIIFDDIDLPLGSTRIRAKGSAGTHNGMKSVIQKLGTEEFPRIRIGTESRGLTAHEKQDTSSFVLADFSAEEEKVIQKNIKKMPEVVKTLVKEGVDFCTKFN